MAKLKLTAEPTFTAPVEIPVAGKDPVKVSFTFRHRTKDELADWLKQKFETDELAILECATGWELDDEFNAENVALLCQSYIAATGSIISAYITELRGARAKN
ncbi:phage tail assembly chaperone [Dyella kyungheensis]|uniref:phage tail assembly chaperone n=1 Tax=Dyella kyungheensis TaxID=1242174 RepID=UPI003CE6E870